MKRLELRCRANCTSCGSQVEAFVVQRYAQGRLSSSVSVTCAACGAAEETDGGSLARELLLQAGAGIEKRVPASAQMIARLQRAGIEFVREETKISFEATSLELEILRDGLGVMSKFLD